MSDPLINPADCQMENAPGRMNETADYSALWRAHQQKLKSVEVCAIEADYAMERAVEALGAYLEARHELGNGADIDYAKVARLSLQMELIVREDF